MQIDLIEVLKAIEDDRDPQGREYKLWEVFLVSVLALLSNSKTYSDICTFAQTHLEGLKAVFGLKWKRVPTASALRKIIVRQDPAEIEKAFRLFSTPCDKKTDESGLMKQICVDGKTLNGSFSHAKDQRAFRVFSAFSCFDQLVLAHIPLSSDKDHEITALQEFIESLEIKNCILSADALHCQKKLFEIAEKKNICFLTQVKDNQESLTNQIKHGCTIQKAKQVYQEAINKEHGRIEQRTYETFDPFPMLDKWKKDWPYIRQIIRVTRFRHNLSTDKKSLETHFYVCNKEHEAKDYSVYIRKHWHIENKLHNVKDNAFLEDKHTKRCNPFVFSCLIDMALNIMRKNKDTNIQQKIYQNSLDFKKMIDKYFFNDPNF